MATQIGNATRGQPPPQRAARQAAAACSPLGASRRRAAAARAAAGAGDGDVVAQLQEEVRRLDAEADALQGEVDRLAAQVCNVQLMQPCAALCVACMLPQLSHETLQRYTYFNAGHIRGSYVWGERNIITALP